MSGEHGVRPLGPEHELRIDYARELNEQQLAAVMAPPGPALVIAGAGSGKTRTLTYRVAYLLEQGIPADRILLLTFTNKAAGEMMRRVEDLVGRQPGSLWGGTFHSIGNRVLRQHASLLGFGRDFTILDREDAKHMVAACVVKSAVEAAAGHARFPKTEVLAGVFSMAANTGRSVAEVVAERYDYFEHWSDLIGKIGRRYAERKLAANAVDFDDLLVLWLRLLRDHADVREYYQRRFQFILVDEYQDTNLLQSDVIDLLAERHRNVMVVGDDAQSIYAWRGANYENILTFPKRYTGARVYKIETNYRSTPEILEVANAAIRANVEQYPKKLSPVRGRGRKPVVVTCGDASVQAGFVAARVTELRESGVSPARMAVLYRSHFHALELQLELTRRTIPFSITSGLRFFEQAHIKDVAAHLKLVTNRRDEISFKRLVQLLPGIGAKGGGKLWDRYVAAWGEKFAEGAAGAKTGDEAAASQATPARAVTVASALRACAASVGKKAAAAWAQFADTMADLESGAGGKDAGGMIRTVVESGYEAYLEQNYANAKSRLDDLEQVSVFARQFATLEEFLTQLALLTNIEAEDARPEAEADEQRLRLSTVHQAKGLEFDVVFVIMLCDGLFPSGWSLKDDTGAGEEEERRLFYVAITRARNELYLSYPMMRAVAGKGDEGLFQECSRFLREIPKELVEESGLWGPGGGSWHE